MLSVVQKEVSNYITLEFTIGREFYGYPEIVGTIDDFIEAGYADAKISATKAKENRTFITLSPENPLMTDLGLVSSIKEITASEAKELRPSKRIFHFTELIFPTNIITKTQYNFSLINYELYDEKEKPYQEETNIEYNKIILTLSQYYVYEMLDGTNPGYVPELAGNFVVNLDGQPGFLIRSKYVYTQYHGEKIYLKYEKNYINYDLSLAGIKYNSLEQQKFIAVNSLKNIIINSPDNKYVYIKIDLLIMKFKKKFG